MYEQYVLVDLHIFCFLLNFCTINYIHCDQKPHKFRLIIKYLRMFLCYERFSNVITFVIRCLKGLRHNPLPLMNL